MSSRDFFTRQDDARRHTAILVAGFALAVAGVVVAVNVVAWCVAIYIASTQEIGGLGDWAVSAPAAWTAAVTLAVIGIGSGFRAAQLAHGGGGRVANLMGGRIVDPDTGDADEKQLINVVEEISIAAGMPPPDVYILDREDGINAFAAGTVPANAAVAFSAGAIRQLDRDELQGVVAHEFSHIANSDMRLNIRLLALLAGVTLIGELGASVWRGLFIRRGTRAMAGMSTLGSRRGSRRSDPRGLLVLLAVGVALIVIGWIGVLVGRVIKAAISRQREFLADAAAVQFTRNPDGIAGALLKIAANRHGGMLQAGRAEEISHMGFTRTVGGLAGLTSTHPPIEERLRAIGPQYVVRYRQQERAGKREGRREQRRRERAAQAADTNGTAAGPTAGADSPLAEHVPDALDHATPGHVASLMSAAAIGALAGNPAAARLDVARKLLARIPPDVYAALHQPQRARHLIWALLLAEPEYTRHLPATAAEPVLALRSALETTWGDGSGGLQANMRLPLLDLTLPALRRLDDADRRTLIETLDHLIRADGRLAIHEYCLRSVLIHHLFPRQRADINRSGLADAESDVRTVIALLCRTLPAADGCREAAWNAAFGALGQRHEPPPFADPPGLRDFSTALERLATLQPGARRDLLAACAAAVTSNDTISATEGELVRAIAAILDTPIPPLDNTADAEPSAGAAESAEPPGIAPSHD